MLYFLGFACFLAATSTEAFELPSNVDGNLMLPDWMSEDVWESDGFDDDGRLDIDDDGRLDIYPSRFGTNTYSSTFDSILIFEL